MVNEDELNEAVLCYNYITTPGVYVINLGATILLSGPAAPVHNNTAGVSLAIDGGGFEIDAFGISGVRPLTVRGDSVVTVRDADLIGGNMDGNGGGCLLYTSPSPRD